MLDPNPLAYISQSNFVGLSNLTCLEVPAGWTCAPGTTNYTFAAKRLCGECPTGHFCPNLGGLVSNCAAAGYWCARVLVWREVVSSNIVHIVQVSTDVCVGFRRCVRCWTLWYVCWVCLIRLVGLWGRLLRRRLLLCYGVRQPECNSMRSRALRHQRWGRVLRRLELRWPMRVRAGSVLPVAEHESARCGVPSRELLHWW